MKVVDVACYVLHSAIKDIAFPKQNMADSIVTVEKEN
jgi:hypothetical protein